MADNKMFDIRRPTKEKYVSSIAQIQNRTVFTPSINLKAKMFYETIDLSRK